jgi:hypothetical protein
MKDDVIMDALEELRGKLPIELHKFYELFRKRTGCGEEVYEVELSKVLVANYRMLNRLRQESYILYYEIPRI